MLALPPENLTDEELLRNAYQYVHDGLPIRWQRELVRRFSELYEIQNAPDVSQPSAT